MQQERERELGEDEKLESRKIASCATTPQKKYKTSMK